MEKDEEEILMFDLQIALTDASSSAAQVITDEIYECSSKLNKLRQIIYSRTVTPQEVTSLKLQMVSIETKLFDLNEEYRNLHNLQLNVASQVDRPHSGKAPD